jgi:hypothetical protein
MYYEAKPGEANDAVFTSSGGGTLMTVTDTGATITTSQPTYCTVVDAHRADCRQDPAEPPTLSFGENAAYPQFFFGDLDDRAVLVGNLNPVIGGAGRDTLRSKDGESFMRGGTGRDRILGGGFADSLDGGLQVDFLSGGSGNDFIQAQAFVGYGTGKLHRVPDPKDVIRCGPGHDTLEADIRDRIAADCERVTYRWER